jgi:hypothetical protein
VALCAGLTAVAEQAPASPVAQSIAEILPLANPRIVRAEAIATDPRRLGEIRTALHDTDVATQIAPGRLRAVLVRLDTVTAARRGALSPVGLALLAKSYDLSPLDYTYAVGRLTFAYNHWTELTPAIRAKAFVETACLRMAETKAVDSIPARVNNRAGALAATLNLRRAWRNATTCQPNY